MITVIKRGTRRRATCSSCGAVLSYEEEDICVNDNSAYVIYCPQCNHEIYADMIYIEIHLENNK
jgi:NAD-dependent SIR2 family protein deacetylase